MHPTSARASCGRLPAALRRPAPADQDEPALVPIASSARGITSATANREPQDVSSTMSSDRPPRTRAPSRARQHPELPSTFHDPIPARRASTRTFHREQSGRKDAHLPVEARQLTPSRCRRSTASGSPRDQASVSAQHPPGGHSGVPVTEAAPSTTPLITAPSAPTRGKGRDRGHDGQRRQDARSRLRHLVRQAVVVHPSIDRERSPPPGPGSRANSPATELAPTEPSA